MKPYYQEPGATVYQGHALTELQAMPSNSVDCVMTSPPYWGLRTYKTEPQIWGDNHCEHEWGEYKTSLLHENRNFHSGTQEEVLSSGYALAHTHKTSNLKAGFCLKCNAWRGELGLEPTIELYISHLIQIFNEVQRVLKKTGTCWVNIDDSYASGTRKTNKPQSIAGGNEQDLPLDYSPSRNMPDYPSKSLCLIPSRFALTMVENGWILRNDIVWNKPNPMPESVKDRFTGSWEHLFFFVKSNTAQYWVNEKTRKVVAKMPLGIHGAEGEDWEWRVCPNCKGTGEIKKEKETKIEESMAESMGSPRARYHRDKVGECKRCKGTGQIKYSFWSGRDYWFEQQFEPQGDNTHSKGQLLRDTPEFQVKSLQADGKQAHKDWNKYTGETWLPFGRNKRDVWEITTQPYPEAHFATFPEKLCETPILAGCPSQVCKSCGKARERIYERTGHINKREPAHQPGNTPTKVDSTGWAPTETPTAEYTDCGCNVGWEPGVVLDPFCGSGKALAVAKRLGRRTIGIDLNPGYCKLTVKELQGIPLAMELNI